MEIYRQRREAWERYNAIEDASQSTHDTSNNAQLAFDGQETNDGRTRTRNAMRAVVAPSERVSSASVILASVVTCNIWWYQFLNACRLNPRGGSSIHAPDTFDAYAVYGERTTVVASNGTSEDVL